MKPWTQERIKPANPWNGNCRLFPNKMQNYSCYQQFPMLESQEGFETNGKLRTKLPAAVPCMESGDRIEGWGFPLKNLGISFSKATGLSPEQNHLPAQTDVPCKRKPIRLRAQGKEKGAQNLEGAYPQPLETARKTVNSKGMWVPHSFFIVLEATRSFLQFQPLSPNLFK